MSASSERWLGEVIVCNHGVPRGIVKYYLGMDKGDDRILVGECITVRPTPADVVNLPEVKGLNNLMIHGIVESLYESSEGRIVEIKRFFPESFIVALAKDKTLGNKCRGTELFLSDTILKFHTNRVVGHIIMDFKNASELAKVDTTRVGDYFCRQQVKVKDNGLEMMEISQEVFTVNQNFVDRNRKAVEEWAKEHLRPLPVLQNVSQHQLVTGLYNTATGAGSANIMSINSQTVAKPARRPGRPRKHPIPIVLPQETTEFLPSSRNDQAYATNPVKKKGTRGRPKGSKNAPKPRVEYVEVINEPKEDDIIEITEHNGRAYNMRKKARKSYEALNKYGNSDNEDNGLAPRWQTDDPKEIAMLRDRHEAQTFALPRRGRPRGSGKLQLQRAAALSREYALHKARDGVNSNFEQHGGGGLMRSCLALGGMDSKKKRKINEDSDESEGLGLTEEKNVYVAEMPETDYSKKAKQAGKEHGEKSSFYISQQEHSAKIAVADSKQTSEYHRKKKRIRPGPGEDWSEEDVARSSVEEEQMPPAIDLAVLGTKNITMLRRAATSTRVWHPLLKLNPKLVMVPPGNSGNPSSHTSSSVGSAKELAVTENKPEKEVEKEVKEEKQLDYEDSGLYRGVPYEDYVVPMYLAVVYSDLELVTNNILSGMNTGRFIDLFSRNRLRKQPLVDGTFIYYDSNLQATALEYLYKADGRLREGRALFQKYLREDITRTTLNTLQQLRTHLIHPATVLTAPVVPSRFLHVWTLAEQAAVAKVHREVGFDVQRLMIMTPTKNREEIMDYCLRFVHAGLESEYARVECPPVTKVKVEDKAKHLGNKPVWPLAKTFTTIIDSQNVWRICSDPAFSPLPSRDPEKPSVLSELKEEELIGLEAETESGVWDEEMPRLANSSTLDIECTVAAAAAQTERVPVANICAAALYLKKTFSDKAPSPLYSKFLESLQVPDKSPPLARGASTIDKDWVSATDPRCAALMRALHEQTATAFMESAQAELSSSAYNLTLNCLYAMSTGTLSALELVVRLRTVMSLSSLSAMHSRAVPGTEGTTEAWQSHELLAKVTKQHLQAARGAPVLSFGSIVKMLPKEVIRGIEARMGTIKAHPDTVAQKLLDKLACNAPQLYNSLNIMLRDVGDSCLRPPIEETLSDRTSTASNGKIDKRGPFKPFNDRCLSTSQPRLVRGINYNDDYFYYG